MACHNADNSPISLCLSIAMCVWNTSSTCHDDKRWRVRRPSTRRLRSCRKHGRCRDGTNASPACLSSHVFLPTIRPPHAGLHMVRLVLFFSVASSLRLWRSRLPTRSRNKMYCQLHRLAPLGGRRFPKPTYTSPCITAMSEAVFFYPYAFLPSLDMLARRMTTPRQAHAPSRTSTPPSTTWTRRSAPKRAIPEARTL